MLFDDVRSTVARLLGEDVPVANAVGRPEGKGGDTTIDEKNDVGHILSRLKRDDPAMARRVIAGELSANAAAITNTEPPQPFEAAGALCICGDVEAGVC